MKYLASAHFTPNFRALRRLSLTAAILGPLFFISAFVYAAPPPGYTLIWSDEFNGAVGSQPNSGYWSYDLGAGGWGNGELENYTSDPVNAHIVNDPNATDGSALQISATTDGQGHYNSARIQTNNKVSVQYGYIEARIKMPPMGQGMWPAFWMLGSNLNQVGWPQCGEMDIMEDVSTQYSSNHGSMHGPGYSGGQALSATYNLPNSQQFPQAYHTFGIMWKPNSVTFYVDGNPYETRTPSDVGSNQWVFNHPFFFIINLAVGGNWPGYPNGTAPFPQNMLVDYVRAYQFRGTNWTPSSMSVGADDVTRLLWNKLDGTADLWNLNAGGYLVSDVHYGPFSGWSATTVSTGADNTSRLVWSNTDGTQNVWRLDANGNFLSDVHYGPRPNWNIAAIGANGSDTNQRLLWVNSATSKADIWTTSAAGVPLSNIQYGPFSSWLPVTLGTASDNTSRLLWANGTGTADVWKLDTSGNLISDIKYGPYSGWSATGLTVAPDGTQRLMWTSISGVTDIWKLDASGSFMSDAHFGPFAGYTSPLLSSAPDGTSRLGWIRNDGLIDLWTTDSGNGQTVFSSVKYGPY